MKSSFRQWTHITTLVLVTLAAVSVRGSLADRYAAERKALNQAASRSRIRELAAYWNGLDYAAAQESWSGQLSARLAWPSDGLTATQVAALKPRLAEVLTYLQRPDFASYTRLKTNGVRWEFSLNATVTNEYSAALGAVNEPAEVMAKLWQATGPPPGAERPRLAAVNLDRMTLVTSRTNSRMTIVNGPTRKGLTTLRVAPEPGFVYAPKHASSEGGGPDELYAHLSFYARSNTSTNAGPVYLSLAWSDLDQQWVLGRLMSGVLLKLEVPF